MELSEQMTIIVAAMLANSNCGLVNTADIAATAAELCDEINAYEWTESDDVPEIPERGGPDTVNETRTED